MKSILREQRRSSIVAAAVTILLGLMLLHGWSLPAFKTLAILLFLWLTSPVSSHLIAEMEVLTIPDIQKECEVEVR